MRGMFNKIWFYCRRRCAHYTIVLGIVTLVYYISFSTNYSNEEVKSPLKDKTCPYTKHQNDLDYTPVVVNELCENVIVYDDVFVHLQNAVINSKKLQMSFYHDQAKGINDQDTDSHFRCCSVKCIVQLDQQSLDFYHVPDNVQKWVQRTINTAETLIYDRTENVVTIAISVTDIISVYDVVRQWYEVYLLASHFKEFSECRINVLFIENQANNDLHSFWNILFGNIKKLESNQKATLYRNLMWLIPERTIPITDVQIKEMPLIESFREFVLWKFGSINIGNKDCKNLKIVLMQKVFPDKAGSERIIGNVEDILKEIQDSFPQHEIKVIQVDIFSLMHHLSYISVTNILIGIHGTGMASLLFLPKKSGVIEIFPIDIPTTNNEYKMLARRRSLSYISWQNVRQWDDYKEDSSLHIPPKIIRFLLKQMLNRICTR